MNRRDFKVLVIGAGFAGMHMLWKLRTMGIQAVVIEQGADVGGTWYWNSYPGARCDVPSLEYSYAFDDALQQEWEWTERFASQPEIFRYLSHVADRFDLRRDIQFNTRVTSLVYDENRNLWIVGTEGGEIFESHYVITATGCLSAPLLPNIKGIEDFRGLLFHTSRWPKEGVEMEGKRVGIIGTGSTGVQVATVTAPIAEHLYVFQRTPQYCLPAFNGPLDPAVQAKTKAKYHELRDYQRNSFAAQYFEPPAGSHTMADEPEKRRNVFEEKWKAGRPELAWAYEDTPVDEIANREAANFVREKIRSTVKDPELAEQLCPTIPLGSRRTILDTGYYEIYNRSNVTLVNVAKSPIIEITEDAVVTKDNQYPVDILVVATGFDAVTGPLLKMNIVGKGGIKLNELWKDRGPVTYLGVMVAGFPNLFTITGPGSPSVHVNVVYAIDQHVEWISRCLADLNERGATKMEATEAASEQWMAHAVEVSTKSLWFKVDSWWTGSNVPGKPRTLLGYRGGLGTYREQADAVAASGYSGFEIS